ncbi:MAG: TerD family protein, partial [Candidatus Contendobacter sp.]|nr:TerD family protein [Candidatus Contendobacter sp.]
MLTFQAGQNLSLSQQTPGLQHLELELSWEPADGSWTLDASAFALTAQSRVRSDGDFIFYNQPALPDGSLQLEPDGRRFTVRLAALPIEVEKVAIALTLDAGGGLSFAALRWVRLELRNGENRIGIASFTLPTT